MAVRINRYYVQLVRESAGTYDLDSKKIRSPYDAAQVVRSILDIPSLTVEHFGILTLDTKNVVIGAHVLSVGSLNAGIAHPRSVFQAALLNNAESVILFHNHPSGDPTPSPEDIKSTKRMIEAGVLLGINVLDHIILGEPNYTSVREYE